MIDKRWMRRLILLDLALVALLGWLGYTVWVEAQAARAAKRAGLTPPVATEPVGSTESGAPNATGETTAPAEGATSGPSNN